MEVVFLFVMVIGLMLIGVPIAVSLGMSSILFLLLLSDTSLASIAQTFFQAMAGHYTLLAIPFFILASSFMSTGGVAKRIIRFSIALVGHFHGGLAIAGVFACMLFAALSGSSPATVVAIGSIVIAGMRQVGYSKDFAAGVISNAGTLGILGCAVVYVADHLVFLLSFRQEAGGHDKSCAQTADGEFDVGFALQLVRDRLFDNGGSETTPFGCANGRAAPLLPVQFEIPAIQPIEPDE